MLKITGVVLLLAAAGYLAVVAVLYTFQRSMMYPGAGAGAISAGSALQGQEIRIETGDGESLFGLYKPASHEQVTILLFHGNGDDIRHYGQVVEALTANGAGVLAVSFRGYPGSSGSPSEAGLLADGLAAYDWLATRTSRIVILGYSLGSAVAVNTAALRRAEGLVLLAPFASMEAIVSKKFPYIPVKWLLKDRFYSDSRIGAVAAPVLFIHGDNDHVVPVQSGRALFERAGEPKEFVVEHGRGHNELWTPHVCGLIIDFIRNLETGR